MNYQIKDIIDINKVQGLLEKYTNATGVAAALIDLKGNILVAAGWRDICTKFHRVHPKSKSRCLDSDVALANQLASGQQFNMYNCMNGLVDAAIPLYIDEVHIANLFTGQYFAKKPNIELFKQQAQNYGFDETEYLEALAKVPIFTDEEVKNNLEFLSALASFIAESGLTKQNLLQLTETQEKRIEERTQTLKEMQLATLNMMQDTENAKQTIARTNIELTEMMEEIKLSNRELEQFAYVASHDLQEPLRMISSYTQLLERRYSDQLDQDAKDFIAYAVDGANRMQRLINDLLEYSRITTRGRDFAKLDLTNVLGIAISNLRHQISDNNALVTNDELPVAMGDELQIAGVFQNIITNAIKFKSDLRPHIHISSKVGDGKITISIKDNGIGIDPQYSERVFVIFQRLHNSTDYPGTGIGLSICKRTIERHNGKIWFESGPGQGTTFYFTLNQ